MRQFPCVLISILGILLAIGVVFFVFAYQLPVISECRATANIGLMRSCIADIEDEDRKNLCLASDELDRKISDAISMVTFEDLHNVF